MSASLRTVFPLAAAIWFAAMPAMPVAATTVGTFTVEPQFIYELRLVTGAAPEGTSARLVFLDGRGEDVAPVEASLGFARSGGIAALPKEGGETVLVSAAGNGTVKAVGARVEIDGADASVVRACSLKPFAACEDPKHVSGIDVTATGTGDFSQNLVKNPSFEEDGCWRWIGSEKGAAAIRYSGDSYTGVRSAALDPATDGEGCWVSDAFPIDATAPLHYSYAIRYSGVAKPHGHANPVLLEFLAQNPDGSFRVLSRFTREFDYNRYGRFAGEWAPVSVRNVPVPAGATHARVVVEHRDSAQIWSGEVTAGWGTILADDIAVWQGDGLPPQLPAGNLRDNSVSAAQDAWRDGALFFDDGPAPTLTLRLENLLAWNRNLELRGVVTDSRNAPVGEPFVREVFLAPFASGTQNLALPDTPRHGAYQVECEIAEPGAGVVCRTRCPFAKIAHPSRATAADKASGFYPFEMHPKAINFNGTGRPEECDFEARMMEKMGVRGVRLQARYANFGLSRNKWDGYTTEQLDEIAVRAVGTFRKKVKPVLDRYGIRGWVSLMEQERANPAGAVKAPVHFEKWERFHKIFARELDGDVDFVLFGNEGIGGYTAHLGDDDDLFPLSGFTGTTRDWMTLARRAVKGMKDGNQSLPVGLSHANDGEAAIARKFLRMDEGGFPLDCWGCNSYAGPHVNAPAICSALGEEGVDLSFFVIPEVGERASSPQEFDSAAHDMVRQYVQTLAREPKAKHIDWFAFSYGAFSVFSSSAGGGAFAPAAAYTVMTDTLRAGLAVDEVPLTGGSFITWRRLDGTSVAVAWSSAGQKVVFAVPDGGSLVESDIYGNIREHAPDNGISEVRIGQVAYYWVGRNAPDFAPGCRPLDEGRVHRETMREALDAARIAGTENIIRNAAFKGDGDALPPEWRGESIQGIGGVTLADCRFTRVEGVGPNGETALFIDNRVKDLLKSGAHPEISQNVPVAEGAKYAFRVLVKKSRYGQWMQPQIDLLDDKGNILRKLPTPESQDKEGGWTIREVDFTVRKGEVTARILLKGNHGGAGADYFACPELRKID